MGRKNRLTKHHITPKSRGGRKLPNNIALVKDEDHRRYHALFINKTPTEILRWLIDYFWDGDYSPLERVLKEYNHEKT